MFTSLSVQGLVDCLSRLPPLELHAVTLLREARQVAAMGGVLPAVPAERVAAATTELIAYTKACAALIGKFASLTPVILPGLECPTWPL
ncbi:MAG: hypothetical protein ACYDBJ_00650 [Aggregatilineales bacterium]